MPRLIRRYGSRKLYDVAESRYVGLDEIAVWVRQGTEVRVVVAQTGKDVTALTLTQIISEEQRRGITELGADFLHEVVRRGSAVLLGGVERLEQGVERAVQRSVDRVPPLREARDELEELRDSLGSLDRSLDTLERREGPQEGNEGRPVTRR